MSADRTARLSDAAMRAVSAQVYAARKKEAGDLVWTADDPDCPDVMRLAALGEEYGEVCRALHDGTGTIGDELAQLAGVALAWIVALEPPAEAHVDQLTIA